MLPHADTPYARWVAWLDDFAAGKADAPGELPRIDPHELGGSVSARLAERCAQAFNRRLDLWQQMLQRDLDHARDHVQLALAMTVARRRMDPLRRFVDSRVVFDELAVALGKGIEDMLTAAQDALERSARAHGRAGEDVLRAVRGTRLDGPSALGPGDPTDAPAPTTGRRVIL